MLTKNIDKLWKEYVRVKDPSMKEKLIIEYAPLVKYVAGRLNIYLGHNVEYDDLISYGIFGLIDAIDKFDPDKGVKFETYASLRIRGAILDNIRKLDWVPRSLRQKNKQLDQVYTDLESELGRPPEDEEVAAKMNISMEEFQDILRKTNILSLISLDEYMDQNYESNLHVPQQKSSDHPESHLEKQELKKMLSEAIDKLTDKEKKVILLYYFEELTLKEISAVMGVSESRISQLHTKAVLRLKGKLGRHKEILYGM